MTLLASVKMKFPDAETHAVTRRIAKALAGSLDWDGERKQRVKNEKPLELKITKVVGSSSQHQGQSPLGLKISKVVGSSSRPKRQPQLPIKLLL